MRTALLLALALLCGCAPFGKWNRTRVNGPMPMTALDLKCGNYDIRASLHVAGFLPQNVTVPQRYYYVVTIDWLEQFKMDGLRARDVFGSITGNTVVSGETCYNQALFVKAALLRQGDGVHEKPAVGIIIFQPFDDPSRDAHAMNIFVMKDGIVAFADFTSGFKTMLSLAEAKTEYGLNPTTARVDL